MISKYLTLFLLVTIAFNTLQAKELKVVCSTSDLAWLAKKIGKEKVTVTALSNGDDNPHFLDSTPKLIRLVSDADLLCFVGLELEIGWLPKVIQKAGNSKVKPEQIGCCDCSTYVEKLEKVNGPVDRSMGDLHPYGNPHYQFDPHQMLNAGKAILENLIKANPEEKIFFTKNFEKLTADLDKLAVILKDKMKDISSLKVTQYHKEYTYLISFLGMQGVESIEKVSGVSPSAERLYSFGQECKKNEVKLCLASVHNPSNKLTKFKSISQVPYLQERVSLINYLDDGAYEKMMLDLVDKIVLSQKP